MRNLRCRRRPGFGLVLEEPIVRIFLWRRHGKSRTRHRTHRAETLAESFISLWLATPRASLARIRQAIATKQLRHGLTGADVQFSGTASQLSIKERDLDTDRLFHRSAARRASAERLNTLLRSSNCSVDFDVTRGCSGAISGQHLFARAFRSTIQVD
jgi:hypothetical protein